MTTLTKKRIAERDEAREELRQILSVGDTVDVIQRHVSQSGMMRYLSLRAGDRDITSLAGKAMAEKVYDYHGHWALKVGGCGMDMHFATVYNLSRALWPNGHPCTGSATSHGERRCPSNDHSNDYRQAQRDFRSYDPDGSHDAMRAYIENRLATDLGYSTKRTHSDGGYALNYRTI